jgi:hypothetical protein
VIAAAGGFYVFKVREMQTENEKLLKEKRYLAARFMDGLDETKWIQRATAPKKEQKLYGKGNPEAAEFKRDYDKKLYKLYPLANPKNIRNVPNPTRKKDIQKLDEDLKAAAVSLSKELLAKYNFKVNPKTDFGVNDIPPGANNPRRFREWVGRQNAKTDAMLMEIGKGISFDLKADERELSRQGYRLAWLSDGSVTGWIPDETKPGGIQVVRPADHKMVLRRLVLRRELLMALCQVSADVPRRIALKDRNGRFVKEEVRVENRRIDRILRIGFSTGKKSRKPRKPYLPHGVQLEVGCHLALVPALLRELETIGGKRGRPFTFWVERCVIRRASGWPLAAAGSGDLNPDVKYGRENEWPVVVLVDGVVPEFDVELDPQP